MKRESLIVLCGILLVFLPFLGIPSAWKRIGYVCLGTILIFVGYQLRRQLYLRSIAVNTSERKTDVYVESVLPPVTISEHAAIAHPEEPKRRGRAKRV